ncbi:MAG: DUF1524 domain-containing protein, partial [Ruminococcaceae bacterium]|nr:DUF1524 domain-containing protein [Oscillospiraceae bacterium]
ARLEGQFLTNPFASNDRIKYKLKPLVSDDDVYQFIIADRIEKIENKDSKIYKNYMYILEEREKLNEKYDHNQILLALNKLYVVCIPLSGGDNAQKIFESINSTGVKLTASDLIRNFLLMDLDSESQEKYYKNYWMELENYLTDDSKKLESFFRFYLAIKNKFLPNINAVYSEFVKWYKSNEEGLDRVEIFKDIVKHGKYYHEIYYKDLNTIEGDLKEAINEFRKILSDMPAPLLMGILDLYYTDLISVDQLSECIFIINNYLIRRALCDIDTSGITRMFPSLLKDVIEDCDGDYSNVAEVLKKNMVFKNIDNAMYVPDNRQLHDLILYSNMYKIKTALRIFLDKLEHDDNPAPVDLKELSIEHLMPQTPTQEWYDELKIDEDEYQRNLNRLGNLTLAAKSDNTKMGNKVWTYKNEILANTSHLIINQAILEKDNWDIDAINERTEKLIEEINRLFPYPQTSSTMIKKEEIFIDANEVKASAYFYLDNGDVEILEGSELFRFNNTEKYPEVEEERQMLIDEGFVFDSVDKMIFKKSYMVNSKTKSGTALSSSASLILHGSRNGWEVWKNSEGILLTYDKKITSLFYKNN